MNESFTVSCEVAGVWEGARVIQRSTCMWTNSFREGQAGIVTAVEERGQGTWWARVAFSGASTPEWRSVKDLHLDFTHGSTRLWATARLVERLGMFVEDGLRFWFAYGRCRWSLGSTINYREFVCSPDLNPSDDTRLEDGTRKVDAQALADVWRQVPAQGAE